MLDKQAKFNSLPVKFRISELADSESQRHQTKVKNRIIRPVIKKLMKLFGARASVPLCHDPNDTLCLLPAPGMKFLTCQVLVDFEIIFKAIIMKIIIFKMF